MKCDWSPHKISDAIIFVSIFGISLMFNSMLKLYFFDRRVTPTKIQLEFSLAESKPHNLPICELHVCTWATVCRSFCFIQHCMDCIAFYCVHVLVSLFLIDSGSASASVKCLVWMSCCLCGCCCRYFIVCAWMCILLRCTQHSSFLNAISHVNKTTDVFEVFGSAFNMKMNEKKNTLGTVHYQYMAKCMGQSV